MKFVSGTVQKTFYVFANGTRLALLVLGLASFMGFIMISFLAGFFWVVTQIL